MQEPKGSKYLVPGYAVLQLVLWVGLLYWRNISHIDIYYNSQFKYKWDRRDHEAWERVSIQQQNRPVQVALTAWQRAAGGYTSADAPNVGESAVAITRQTNMPQNTTRTPAIPLSRASSTGRIGSTITAHEISLPGLSYQAPTPIPWTNLCLDRLDKCPQNGNRSLMNKVQRVNTVFRYNLSIFNTHEGNSY